MVKVMTSWPNSTTSRLVPRNETIDGGELCQICLIGSRSDCRSSDRRVGAIELALRPPG
jgi:hypothetical protein